MQTDQIVTFNLSDFPKAALDPCGIAAQHPDAFVQHVIDLAPGIVLGAVERLRSSLRNPPVDKPQYLDTIEPQGLPGSAAKLRGLMLPA